LEETRPPQDGSGSADQDDDSEAHESDGSEEDEGESSMGSVSDAEDAPGDLDDLEAFVVNLDPSERKSTGEPDHDAQSDSRPRQRRMVEERTEVGADNELYAQLNSMLSSLASTRKSSKSRSVNTI
jgi:hypothetical protein